MNHTERSIRIRELLNDPELDDDNANFSLCFRDFLITGDLMTIHSNELTLPQRRAMLELRYLLADADTELITELRLANSLCPLHAIDYAICFDDDDAECALIRLIHPSHDT